MYNGSVISLYIFFSEKKILNISMILLYIVYNIITSVLVFFQDFKSLQKLHVLHTIS